MFTAAPKEERAMSSFSTPSESPREHPEIAHGDFGSSQTMIIPGPPPLPIDILDHVDLCCQKIWHTLPAIKINPRSCLSPASLSLAANTFFCDKRGLTKHSEMQDFTICHVWCDDNGNAVISWLPLLPIDFDGNDGNSGNGHFNQIPTRIKMRPSCLSFDKPYSSHFTIQWDS